LEGHVALNHKGGGLATAAR